MNCKTKTRHIRQYMVFLLVLPILAAAAPRLCGSQPVNSSPALPIPEIAEQNEQREEVRINGEAYIIPPPWAGNRLDALELDFSDFRQIPVDYTYNNTRLYILAVAYQPLVALLQAAEKEEIILRVESAYRSEGYQKKIFKRMLAEGRTFADIIRYIAPPGYSQHMLGTCVDFFPSNWRFADTAEYSWLLENGRRFGFEEPYSQFNAKKMPWEAWHWNFSGVTEKLIVNVEN